MGIHGPEEARSGRGGAGRRFGAVRAVGFAGKTGASIQTASAQTVSTTGATVIGTVKPNGSTTSYSFQLAPAPRTGWRRRLRLRELGPIRSRGPLRSQGCSPRLRAKAQRPSAEPSPPRPTPPTRCVCIAMSLLATSRAPSKLGRRVVCARSKRMRASHSLPLSTRTGSGALGRQRLMPAEDMASCRGPWRSLCCRAA